MAHRPPPNSRRRKVAPTKARGDRARRKPLSDEEKDFLDLARDRFSQGTDADENQRERELDDLRFAAGGDGQWDPGALAARAGNDGTNGQQKTPARPVVTINQTLEPLNQLLAQMLDADLGFELVPADDFADLIGDVDPTEITIREGLARRIQRDSQAVEARLWGAERGNICGRGYWAVLTRFVEGKSFDQEIYIHKFYDQFAVTLDPNREHFDGSDAEWGFVGHDMPWDEYTATFGRLGEDEDENTLADASDDEFRALGEDFPGWFTGTGKTRSCRVVDYYYTVREPRELVQLADNSVAWADELPKDFPDEGIVDRRSVVQRKIKFAKIDGAQILEPETDWPSPWLPIVEYVARAIQPFDEERRYEGIVGPMKDPGKGLNWMATRMVEIIGYAPLASFMMAAGQDEGFEDEYNGYTQHTMSTFHYNQADDMGRPAPPPFRPPTNTDIGPVAGAIAMFKEGIQQTSMSHATSQGEPDPALRNAKMIAAVVANDQRGDSGFIHNWSRSIRHEGRIINSLLYPIYGTRPGRLASIIDGTSGKPQTVMINQPFQMHGQGSFAKPMPMPAGAQGPDVQKFVLTPNANFNVVVKVTKSFETRRQEEANQLGQIIAADPQNGMSVYGDLYFKNQDGPGHAEMAERAKIMLAPQVQQAIAAKAQGLDIPPPVQAMLSQLQQKVQEQEAIITQAQAVIQGKVTEGQTQIQRTQLEIERDLKLAEMNNAAKIEAARISAAKQASDPAAEAAEELLATGIQHAQDNFAAERDHQRALELSKQEHAQALEQGDQAHQQTLTQNAQQAALAPASPNGTGA
jgi:hypothetical protein